MWDYYTVTGIYNFVKLSNEKLFTIIINFFIKTLHFYQHSEKLVRFFSSN